MEKAAKLKRAKKRVAQLRGFYNHVTVYIIVNGLLLLLKSSFTFVLVSKRAIGNPPFLDWIDWNVYGTPIVWGIGLGIHAIKVWRGGSFFGRQWEERQLAKFIQEEHGKK